MAQGSFMKQPIRRHDPRNRAAAVIGIDKRPAVGIRDLASRLFDEDVAGTKVPGVKALVIARVHICLAAGHLRQLDAGGIGEELFLER